MSETFGHRIRRFRVAKGWSGATLASKLGCSEPALSYWENDHRAPRPHNLASMARLFGVSVSYLETGEPNRLELLHRAIRSGATQQQLLQMIGPEH